MCMLYTEGDIFCKLSLTTKVAIIFSFSLCAAVKEISDLLNTGLDDETLRVCVQLLEAGVNPEALATVVRELRRETTAIKVRVINNTTILCSQFFFFFFSDVLWQWFPRVSLVPRPSQFFFVLQFVSLPCILLNANRITKMGEAWERGCPRLFVYLSPRAV